MPRLIALFISCLFTVQAFAVQPDTTFTQKKDQPVSEPTKQMPVNLEVSPAGDDCSIVFRLPETRLVTITVRDGNGSMKRFMQIGGQARYRSLPLNLSDFESGRYTVVLEANGERYELFFDKQ